MSVQVPRREPADRPVGWPRWMATTLVITGLIVVVAETTSLLLFAGIALIGAGTYGFVSSYRRGRVVRRSGGRAPGSSA